VVSNLESEDDVAEEHGVEIPDIPPSPSLPNIRKVASPIWALASAGNTDGLVELSLGDAAERQFIIPLQSDVAFFNVLTAALKSLSAFHTAQQENFTVAVRGLCDSISQSIQPGDRPIVLPLNATDTPRFEYAPPASMSQKDLYAWRDIFSLWIEAQIFESSAERDRGERTVEEAERRLKLFANEVVKRGLGDRRSFKGKRTRKAWDEFLRLNVLLLDLKRFQTANISAARKILKKHDKRTALTATVQSSALDGNVWRFYNTSLPHVLLASMTDTLLP
jgi:hypothetical protein